MIIIIPNYLKPLGWLFWKLRISLRIIEELGEFQLYSGKTKLESGKDYKIKNRMIIFITDSFHSDIKFIRTVKHSTYIIKLLG